MLFAVHTEAFAAIHAASAEFRALVEGWRADHPYLAGLQEKLRVSLGYDDYRVETPIVYNRALDEVRIEDDIDVILVADNPGKNEQLAKNNRYLVGQSGKLAEGWFAKRLGLDFRKRVLILNKTPVHTPKTAELTKLLRSSAAHRSELDVLLAGSQAAMADLAWRLFTALRRHARNSLGGRGPVLWISGLGELRTGGLFEVYRDELSRRLAKAEAADREAVWAFNHFSMNQFAIEVTKKASPNAPLLDELVRLGGENRRRVFGI